VWFEMRKEDNLGVYLNRVPPAAIASVR